MLFAVAIMGAAALITESLVLGVLSVCALIAAASVFGNKS